jgi:hypothetical protein
MKKLNLIILIICISSKLWSQSPSKFSYQAVVRGVDNILISNKLIGLKISILQGSINGNSVYIETHTPNSNENGLVSVSIGGGNVLSGDFSKIDWSNGLYFVKTETDPTGGANYSLITTSQLLSVPYAIHANVADSVVGLGKSNSMNNYTHYIGEQFGGGIIFNLWKDKQGVEHGLVVALTDQSNSLTWSNVTTTQIGGGAASLWDGLSNSKAIVGQAGHTNSAAKLCLDLQSGGFNDWYLPSIQELNLIWLNYFIISQALENAGGSQLTKFVSNLSQVSAAKYWSSSESMNSAAWFFDFNLSGPNSYQNNLGKIQNFNVRAVRVF